MEKKVVNEINFQELNSEDVVRGQIDNQKAILNSGVNLDATIGSAERTISDILNIKVGDVIVLDKKAEDLVDIRVNETKFAKGETLMIDGKIGIKILEF